MIGIIDYGSGNFTSVYQALKSLTDQISIIHSGDGNPDITHILFPGVGAYASVMEKIKKLKLDDYLIQQVVKNKKPFLGICVGMQILSKTGFEFGTHTGLDWINSEVNILEHERLPHMGWNEVHHDPSMPIFNGVENDSCFYFVHSYAMRLNQSDSLVKVATTEYGHPFISAVQYNNIFGVQFHPEKSQECGLRLLKNFIEL